MNLYDKNNKRTCLIHREVAKAFILNPNNYPCVNHEDLNKQNNCVSNLEWCSYSYNTKDAIKKGAGTMKGFNNYNKNKFKIKYGSIFQYSKDMILIAKYDSLIEANIKTGVCPRNILQCISHKEGRTQAGGYIWLSEREVVKNEL